MGRRLSRRVLGMAEDLIFGYISEQSLYNLNLQLYVNTIPIIRFRSASFRISYSANKFTKLNLIGFFPLHFFFINVNVDVF